MLDVQTRCRFEAEGTTPGAAMETASASQSISVKLLDMREGFLVVDLFLGSQLKVAVLMEEPARRIPPLMLASFPGRTSPDQRL